MKKQKRSETTFKEKYQMKIGLDCIVIDVLHLFLSNWSFI